MTHKHHDHSTHSKEQVQRSHQHILHPCTSIIDQEHSEYDTLIDSANGIYINDSSNKNVIDGIAGLWCSNLGHGRPEIAETLKSAASKLDYFHTFNGITHQDQINLSKQLIDLAPDGLNHVFFGCSGSDANDTLIKIAWQYHITRGKPRKRKIISRWQAYHGTSISTASLTGLKSFHTAFNLPLDFVVHTDAPFYFRDGEEGESESEYTQRLLANLQKLIETENAETIAAFIGEPIMGAGGVITPPKGYWEGVQKICRDNDILLIMDEVVCGYGRTGKAFGSEHFNVQADMMATAKGLTAGVFPMSAAFISHDIHNVMRQASKEYGSFFHGYTYSGHPIGSAVALKVVEIIKQEQLISNSEQVGEYLHSQLKARLLHHPHVGEIRGKGLLAAIQLIKNKDNKEFYEISDKIPVKLSSVCKDKGLVIRPLPSVGALALSPPLTLSKAEVDKIVNIVTKVIFSEL